jgi:FkbM family methyltransferase
MAAGTFEPDETAIVREILQDSDLLINVGANVGYYCCHALSMGKPVIAMEPVARNLHYLLRNIHENGWAGQAEIYPVALGAKTDILQMWGGGTGASLVKGWAGIPESYFAQVPVLTLDRIVLAALQGQRALIIVDVEGAEYNMLQGSIKTLEHKHRPVWLVEIGSTTHQPQGVTVNPYLTRTFRLFFERGYVATTADAAQSPIDSSLVQRVAEGNGAFGTHNFLFK